MRFRLSSIPFPLLLALAAVTGIINVFAFAPYGLWPLQLITLALLVFCLLQIGTSSVGSTGAGAVKRGALLGWAYGFGWVAHGVYWIYISLHDFGGLVANHLGRVPRKGDEFTIDNVRFEVLRADARQVHVLLVEKLSESAQEES